MGTNYWHHRHFGQRGGRWAVERMVGKAMDCQCKQVGAGQVGVRC